MKRPNQEQLDSMARRNEADMRMIGGIVGVVCGGFIGFYMEARLFRHALRHASPWAMLIIPLIAGCVGGVIGYFKDTWRTGL